LKASGLEIKDIKKFMEWCVEGPATYTQRKELFETRKAAVETEMIQLQKTLDMLKFKCWYYETAIKDGSEDKLMDMIPDGLPSAMKKMYDNAHS
jgi:DNA-binding transcriptional MerR regulator